MDTATEPDLYLWSVSYDGQPGVEVIAADEWEALDKTQPPRDAEGRRTWRRAWAMNVTPPAPGYCTLS